MKKTIAVILIILLGGASIFSYLSLRETFKETARPEAPALTSSYTYGNSIVITWKGVKDADAYKIYRKQRNAASYRLLAKVNKRSKQYYDKKIKPGKQYIYTVQSIKYDEKSSSPIGTFSKNISILEEPVILGITNEKKTRTLHWCKSDYAQGYCVFTRKNTSSNWKKIGQTDATAFALTDYNPAHYYAVQAYSQIDGNYIYSTYDTAFTEKNKRYQKKKLLFDGASSTYGFITRKKRAIMPFPARVSLLTGATAVNIGVSGSTFSSPQSGKSLVERVLSGQTSYKGYDVICIYGGVNDYHHNRKIGKITDQKTDTVYGAMNFLLHTIKQQNPKAKVVLITPMFSARYRSHVNINCYAFQNQLGLSLEDYRQAIKKIAKKYHAYVYDAKNNAVITRKNYKERTMDFLHPTQASYIKIGDSITDFLLKNRLL